MVHLVEALLKQHICLSPKFFLVADIMTQSVQTAAADAGGEPCFPAFLFAGKNKGVKPHVLNAVRPFGFMCWIVQLFFFPTPSQEFKFLPWAFY